MAPPGERRRRGAATSGRQHDRPRHRDGTHAQLCIVWPPGPGAGALSRMLERGARSVAMIFRAIVFTFVPTVLELAGGWHPC